MSMTEIIVPLTGTPSDAASLARAAAVGAALGAPVTALLAQADPVRTLAWAADGAFTLLPESAVTATREALDLVHDRCVASVAKHAGVRLERLVGLPETLLAERAVLACLGVFDLGAVRAGGDVRAAFETLLMDARLPVLLASGRSEPPTEAVIAWDGGAAAARALRAALPLLKRAGRVTVAQVPEPILAAGRVFADPAHLINRLAGLGIQAEPLLIPAAAGRSPASLILEAASGRNAGLLVAGAYGHARLREVIFGGATRHLLAEASGIDLLLAH